MRLVGGIIETAPPRVIVYDFRRQATPRKEGSPFVNNNSHFGLLKSQSVRNDLIIHSRLIDVNDFVSHMFLNLV